MYLRNNIKFDIHAQHIIGDTQYPCGWFNDPLERAKLDVIEVPDPVKPDESLFTFVENTDGSYTSTPRTADDVAAYQANKDADQAQKVRALRNQLLNNSDWTQVADAPVDKAVWAIYRQALRDLTTQAGFPWTITWPDEPQ